jgi:hypothetical protein
VIKVQRRGNWQLYWGSMPLPRGAEALGVVEVSEGDEKRAGALIRLKSGVYVQGNAGGTRSLDQAKVKALLNRRA